MRKVLVIGNKPYKNLDLDSVFDEFEEIFRCNMSLPNKNNGTKFGSLGLCNHLYDKLVRKKVDKNCFIKSYKESYDLQEMSEFYDRFLLEKERFNNIFYANPRTSLYNSLLKKIGCPHLFSRQPRTGYAIMMECLLDGKEVAVANFSYKIEHRKSFYVLSKIGESDCHSIQDEISILQWLHNNGKIDASLCFLKDEEKPEFDASKMTISSFMSKIFFKRDKELTFLKGE